MMLYVVRALSKIALVLKLRLPSMLLLCQNRIISSIIQTKLSVLSILGYYAYGNEFIIN